MKAMLLTLLLSAPAAASIQIGPGSSGSGVFTNGQSIQGKNATFETLTSTGTAPSLTATGGVFTSSLSVVSPGDAGQIGALTVINNTGSIGQQIKFRHPVASSIKSFGYDNNYGAFLFSDNDAGDSTTATSFFQVTRLGRMRIGDAASYLSYPVPGARIHVTSTGSLVGILIDGAATSPLTIGVSTLVVRGDTGNLGIGTASPLAKLSVNGDSSFASPATFISSVTAPITQVGGTQATANGRAYQSTDYLRVAAAAGNAGTDRTAVRWSGGGYDSNPSANNAESNGDKLVFYNDGTGKAAIGLGSGYDIWVQASGGSGVTFWTGTGATPINAVNISQSGGLRSYSRTIAQLLAITPIAVGEQFFCNNCSPAKLVVSTGTSAGNFADAIGGAFQ